ncbi:MAG TPA: hypothetical protein VJU18_17225 [Vicinamibacteria bacterium]|nr:hypothetical protein [Vicinamibacteria bacterium]
MTLTGLMLAARLLSAHETAGQAVGLQVVDPHAQFEDAYQQAMLTHRFLLRNPGPRPITIVETYDPQGSAQLTLKDKVMPPGAEDELVISQPLRDRLGKVTFRYSLVTDEPDRPRYRMSLSGFVESAFDPEAPSFSFPMADRDRETTAEHNLFSREVERLEVLGMTGLPSFLEVRIAGRAGLSGEGLALKALLKPGAPLGLRTGTFELRTNVVQQPILSVRWSANVFADIVPSANPVNLGLVRAGEGLRGEVVLKSRQRQAFEVTTVEDPAGRLAWSRVACDPPEKGCQKLALTCRSDEPATLQGEIRVFFSGHAEPIPLRYVARFVSPHAAIKDIRIP